MSLTEIFRSTAFRLACAFAGFFGATTLLLFAFIYWQTAGFETSRIETVLMEDARSEASRSPAFVRHSVETFGINDFHHFTFTGIFDATANASAAIWTSCRPACRSTAGRMSPISRPRTTATRRQRWCAWSKRG
ncbi:MAG: hypothetical protein WDN69_16665 [Aliidongia sp.]